MTAGYREGHRDDNPFIRVLRGDSPVVLSAPHGGWEIPEVLRPFADPEEKIDLHTDLLLEEVAAECEARGFAASGVVALFARGVLDLNWGRERTRGVPELEELFDAYYRALHRVADAAVERHGFALVLDIHGYDDGGGSGGRHPFPPDTLVFGTRRGELVPGWLRPAYDAFRKSLQASGFPLFPAEGFNEYTPFVGGSVVDSFRGRRNVAAVMLEIPRGIRLDARKRNALASAMALALAAAIGAGGSMIG
ncbi:N-formylglutamate amidohydrolase [Candidatus Solincola tengchongensis]|uniref:N-formylglutamate amidohydrolase n=1 Tax=Candidatus Solincola tengchongensis TaxID=2900693 RepID=UPI00257CE83D|nr:N-formylglutamate amidohydrolase [Candidatus Solincola tengchongensis]